jgi:phosphoribosylcarboxyaminoimidazole (NCAIR) mutase
MYSNVAVRMCDVQEREYVATAHGMREVVRVTVKYSAESGFLVILTLAGGYTLAGTASSLVDAWRRA